MHFSYRLLSYITRGGRSGLGGWRFCSLEKGVLKYFYSLKFTNFLKDVILYVKQLKIMVLSPSNRVLKFFLQSEDWGGRESCFLCMLLGMLNLFPMHHGTKPLTPPLGINDCSLSWPG